MSSRSVFSWVLKNPDTGATFTVIQQDSTPSTATVSVSATLDTSEGIITVPDIALNGRQSKILVTDYKFGSHTLLYSSSDVLTTGVFDVDVLVLYLKAGQDGEFAFKGENGLNYIATGSTPVAASSSATLQSFTYTQATGATAVKFSNGVLVYLLEQETAWKFWAPSTVVTPFETPDKKVFILGPYLVRNVSISHQVLHVSGDSDNSTLIEAYVGAVPITTIDWNGQRLATTKTPYGSYVATIPGAESRLISLPSLTRWRSAESLPEMEPGYDDSKWTLCNKTTTRAPVAPLSLPVLFSSDYGYYSGAKVYRGYFDSSTATSVNLTCSGGLGFGWNAWLNGVFLGGHPGNGSLADSSLVLAFPSGALQASDNLITVLVDYHGHDEASTRSGVENPRGILGAVLLPGGTATASGFKQWKLQGNAGGSANIDPVRGPMNEGGLFYERLGWAMPGFDPSAAPSSTPFDNSSPSTGLAAAGVRFYTTTFRLNIDSDLDVPLGIQLAAPAGTVARVMIWVNGYQYAKYVPHLGPQTRFPVPPGILNNRGENTLALSIWAQTAAGARLNQVELVSYGAYQTDFGFSRDWSTLQPRWTDRSQYA